MNVIATALAVLIAQTAPTPAVLHVPPPPLVPPFPRVQEALDLPLSWDNVGSDIQLSPTMKATLALADGELESRVEKIALNVRASRDYSGALVMLNAIWIRATRSGTATPKLMSLIALHRASALHKLGRVPEALAAASSLFPDKETVHAAIGATAIKRGKDGAEWESARADERLRELRATLRASMSEPEQGDDQWVRKHLDDDAALAWLAANIGLPSETLADLVWKALQGTPGHQNNIQSLGLRSVPSLAMFSLRLLQVDERLNRNPLVELERLDSRLAAKLCAEWASAGDASWRLALLDVLKAKTDEHAGWSKADQPGMAGGRLPENGWLEVFAPLLRDERVRLAAVTRMRQVVRWNAVPESAQEALGDALRTGPAEKTLELLSELETDYWAQTLVPALEQALLHESLDVRHVAAEQLSALDAAEEIARSAREPDTRIRLSLAKAIASSRRPRRMGTSENSSSHHPEPTPAIVAAWVKLLADGDQIVAHAAARAISSWSSDVPEAVYRAALDSDDEEIRRVACADLSDTDNLPYAALAELWTRARTDPSPLVRRAAVRCKFLPPSLVGETLRALAVDDDATVRAAVDDIFFKDDYGSAEGPALVLRVGHPEDPFRPGQGTHSDWKSGWFKIKAHENVDGVRAAIASGEDVALASLIEYLSERGSPGQRVLLQLEESQIAHIIAWSRGRPHMRSFVDRALVESGANKVQGAMRLLLVDPEQTLPVRLEALSNLREALWSRDAEDAIVQVLEDPAWKDAMPETALRIKTRSERRNPFVFARVLKSEAIEPTVRMAAALALFDSSAAGAQPAALLLLESLGTDNLSDKGAQLISWALKAVAQPGAPPEIARHLIAAARHPRLAHTAIQAMDLHGELVYREALTGCLLSRGYDKNVQGAAATALVRYGTEARPALQEALLFAHPGAVSYVTQALNTLKTWEAQQEGKRTLGTRDEAVDELLALLEHEQVDVRAEAVRGIATFGAIEAIPRLIPLLHDPEALVRTAARAALDRLHESDEGGESND